MVYSPNTYWKGRGEPSTPIFIMKKVCLGKCEGCDNEC